jgi:hypothetical protein
MKCARIKKLLSDYVDGILDEEDAGLLEVHLADCRRCQKELVSLRALVSELNQLESVKAPPDFLDQLHQRLASHSPLKEIIRKLFYPLRIKIPLELATAAALAVLIISIISVQSPEKSIIRMPAESVVKPEGPVQEEKIKLAEPLPKLERYASEPAVAKTPVPKTIKVGKPIELALVLKPAARLKTDVADAPLEVVPPQAPGKGTSVGASEKSSMALSTKQKSTRQVMPQAVMEEDASARSDRTAALSPEARSELKKPHPTSVSLRDKALNNVQNLVRKVGGTILSVEYDPQTKQPQWLKVNIPADRYQQFTAQLENIASLQAPLPPLSTQDQTMIPIRIRFILAP